MCTKININKVLDEMEELTMKTYDLQEMVATRENPATLIYEVRLDGLGKELKEIHEFYTVNDITLINEDLRQATVEMVAELKEQILEIESKLLKLCGGN